MYTKRKVVYGKSKHASKNSDHLWDEAITASPIVIRTLSSAYRTQAKKLTIVSSTHPTSEKSHEDEKVVTHQRKVLKEHDPNTASPSRNVHKPLKTVTVDTPLRRPQAISIDLSLNESIERSNDQKVADKEDDEMVEFTPLMASTPVRPAQPQSIAVHTIFDDTPRGIISPEASHAESSDLSSLSSLTAPQSLEAAFGNLTTNDTSIYPTEIDKLLALCKQTEPEDFAFYMKEILDHSNVCKLGEASYSEVFLCCTNDKTDTTVLKVIPFGDGTEEIPIHDIIQELRISRSMSDLEGFVRVKGMKIVQGLYPECLLQQWDLWNSENESESERPDWYKEDQRYCVVSLENGGTDLEHHEMTSWQEAHAILLEVVKALALGETKRQFEHRDLHWGNILVDQAKTLSTSKITIIDYTLSRATVEDEIADVAFYGFADKTIFEAEGDDYQFDIYRLMQEALAVDGEVDWSAFHPATNVIWLHYVVDKLLYAKGLKRPATRKTKRLPVIDQAEVDAYTALERIWRLLNPRRRYQTDEAPIDSAVQVMELLSKYIP